MSQTRDNNSEFGFDYPPSLESLPVSFKESYGLFINNSFSAPGELFESLDPSSGRVISKLTKANKSDVGRAFKAARAAQPAWAALPGGVRGQYLFKIARLLGERMREGAVIEAIDGGKVISEARDIDLPLAVQHFFYYAGWADKLDFACPDIKKPVPLGVVGAIIPWNFPMLMLAWKIAPALACGNTIVLKPAETTSLGAMWFCEIILAAGLPKGVVNIITGDGQTGEEMVKNNQVDKIAFTGSTSVGKKIASLTNKATLELGGKSANIVFADCAIDQAVESIIEGIFFNRGHVCCAGSRLLVEESIEEVIISKLKRRMDTLIVGPALDKNSDIGPINSLSQLNTIKDLVKSAEMEGASVYQSASALPRGGLWFKPTLLIDVTPAMRVAREEIFGPVLSVMTFRTPDEAISLANSSPYGLAAGVWTNKGSKALEVTARLKAGVVWQNSYNLFDAASPFGGIKESGYGREGGIQGLRDYLGEGV